MKKVLIADDDQSILDATRLLLEYEGYEVTTVCDGDELKDLGDDLPDLILLDIWLSGSNGGELAKYLKSQEKTKNIPIILFSANRDIEKIAKESGADDFLIKPFELTQLLQKINKHIN